ncbi:gliding motility-associated lipoprotein GldJ/gliding motility-associated lipoprotein GldJ,TIGR03530 [Cyclobacterium xiamenense]|uniref:Gliding motility-associated lipoprotein GldJ/gliding motility-associated lipoprotein GldJ,TIGR03530 n=1 Tax=Cyclobacterium xiamenense TaxID=1297121 RepID=A0A1H6WMM7_9BACT|nr:gliding motility lipoprotein GldJ [Cyclobacterium xiamenense]SEJ14030.1 gliding motility-associated lipoprotein GldJ/gliding motility-associated lipoprotein GldJ,TIGR03530 [Cyclobacterium xiamenense]
MKLGNREFNFSFFAGLAVLGFLFASCGNQSSRRTASDPGGISASTGARYSFDEEDSVSFQVFRLPQEVVGPRLVFIQGGRAVLGSQEQDIMGFRDNVERTVTIASFYMDETEVTNVDYKEFLFNMAKRDGVSADSIQKLEPNEKVWDGTMSYNDVYATYYFRYPGFNFYPVAGVSWVQANAYSKWRTAYVNELEREKNELDSALTQDQLIERGSVFPDYRLPNEAEWEFAAKAMIGTQYMDENQENGRIYPWDGRGPRNPYNIKRKSRQGDFLANFKRGRGDYAGIPGSVSNDGEIIPTNVYDFPANDFGLYNMAGNMNEWVQDVYRPLSFQDFDDLNPLRKDGVYDEENTYNTTLIDDNYRVYKGGSWRDVAYWLAPGTRRFMHQDSASNHIGFRCAMIAVGGKDR